MPTSLAGASVQPVSSTRSTALRVEYRPDIDGLRAVAVVSVIGAHTGYLAGGSAGVDIFFVISGFLITGIIFNALSHERFSLVEFYIRRIKRIFPALIVVLFVTWALGWLLLLPDEFQGLGKDIVSSSLFIHDFGVYWWVPRTGVPTYNFSREMLGPIWSLGVEEQFYLLWPLFLLLMWRVGKGLLTVAVLITALSLTLSVATNFWNPTAVYFLPWNRLWELSAGGLLAYAQLYRVPEPILKGTSLVSSTRSTSTRHVFGYVGTALLLASIAGVNYPNAFPEWWALAPSLGAVLTIYVGPKSHVNRYVLGARPMVGIGLISYPLYLWHAPVLWFGHILESQWVLTPIATVTVVAVSFVAAFLTYRYVEVPIRYSSRGTKIVYELCLLMTVCGTLGYLTYTRAISVRPEPSDVVAVENSVSQDWLTNNANTTWSLGPNNFVLVGNGPHRVLFMGDSNMRQYYPRVSEVLSNHSMKSRSAVFAVREWCAPAAVDMMAGMFPDTALDACKATIEQAAKYASDPSVDTVVIAACWYLYFVESSDFSRLGEDDVLKPGTDRALNKLTEMISRLVVTGKRVYIVLSAPISPDFDPHMLIRRKLLPQKFVLKPAFRMRDDIEYAFRRLNLKLAEIAEKTGAKIINPVNSLCSLTVCPAISSSGMPIYHDMFNLSPSYVRSAATFIDVTLDSSRVSPSDRVQHVNAGLLDSAKIN